MVQSNARTVDEYLESLPEDRQKILTTVRAVILDNLPEGYEEGMLFGMIGYFIPLSRYPDTYNRQPLAYVSLASQKNHVSLYLNGVYGDRVLEERFRSEWAATGKKLNMGKSCVRFRKLDDIPLEVVGRSIATTSVDGYIEIYERSRV
jgi:hypothetical protein